MSAAPRTLIAGPLELTVINRTSRRLPSPEVFAGAMRQCLKRNRPAEGRSWALTLVVTTDDDISSLSGRFGRGTAATDVLAFQGGMVAGENSCVALGDVVISRDRALAEGRERGWSHVDEMRLYALHGLLHLLGYNDGTPADRRRMFEEQAAIVGAKGGELD